MPPRLRTSIEVVERRDVHDRPLIGDAAGHSALNDLKPVAFATIACSKLIFEPSAKDVTIAGFCPHCSANPCCVVGLRYGS